MKCYLESKDVYLILLLQTVHASEMHTSWIGMCKAFVSHYLNCLTLLRRFIFPQHLLGSIRFKLLYMGSPLWPSVYKPNYFRGQFTFSPRARRLSRKRGQKSLKSGRSIFFRLSLVLASTLTYSWVTGSRPLEITTNMEKRGRKNRKKKRKKKKSILQGYHIETQTFPLTFTPLGTLDWLRSQIPFSHVFEIWEEARWP